MKCEYRGKNEEDHNFREAYITYNANEEDKFQKLYVILKEQGWELQCEEECAGLMVFDKDEYDEFYECYKKAKGEVYHGRNQF